MIIIDLFLYIFFLFFHIRYDKYIEGLWQIEGNYKVSIE